MLKIDSTPIEGVIFDMDGLMYDTETLFVDTVAQAGAEFGYDIPPEVSIGALGMNVDGIHDYFIDIYGADFPFYKIRERRLFLTVDYCEKNGMPCKHGLYELIDFLWQHNIPMAVATSSERARPTKYLALSHLTDKFTAVVSGEDAERSKPDPQIFNIAAEKIGVNPKHCIVLEDSINGIKAAIATGGFAVMIPDKAKPTAELRASAYAVLDTLENVIGLFD